jgi:Rhs element Vgr protein
MTSAASSAEVAVVLEVDGQQVPSHVSILAIEVCNRVNRIPYARLRLADGSAAQQDFPLSAGDLFVPGTQLRVLGGTILELLPLFSGVILEQRLGVRRDRSWLEVVARAAPYRMTLTPRMRTFEDVTDSDVVETLLAEHEVTGDVASTEVTHPQLLQFRTTDWDFLISRLEANGQLCVFVDDTLRTFVPEAAQPQQQVTYGANLHELDAELDARTQVGSYRGASWDPANQALAEVDAADPGWTGPGDLDADHLTGITGRTEQQLWHGGGLASDALQAWADARLLRSRMAAVRGRARFRGLTELLPGSMLELTGLGARINGPVFVAGVRHELHDNVWWTDAELGLCPDSHEERFGTTSRSVDVLSSAMTGLHVGVVTQLADDPAAESRIRVKIPIAGMDEQGVWARVATLDAGSDRGTFFRPEVDDEVVLGFFDRDPLHPVVLGMLHSSAKAPPIEATEDNHEKAYVSRSGIKLLFDDDGVAVKLETPEGNLLSLSEDDGGITIEDQNGNSLVMSSSGIKLTSAKDIELKADGDLKAEGVNAELKASAAFKADGSTSAELTSSGTLTIKGSLVQIN